MEKQYLIIGGVPKSGTTSLFRYLGDHPDICPSVIKEVNFFLKPDVTENPAWRKSYHTYFRNCLSNQFFLEASPGYLMAGNSAAKQIIKLSPGYHLFFILRDPVMRLFSRWKSFHNRKKTNCSFSEFVENALDPTHNAMSKFISEKYQDGFYAKYIMEYLEIVPKERIHIFFFEDFIAEPKNALLKICEITKLSSAYYDNYQFSVENKSRRVKNRNIHRVAHWLNRRFEIILQYFPGRMRRGLRDFYYQINEKPEYYHVPEGDLEKLRKAYQPYNQDLFNLLKREFPDLTLPNWLNSKGEEPF